MQRLRRASMAFVKTFSRFLCRRKSRTLLAGKRALHPLEMEIGEVQTVRYWPRHKRPPLGWVTVGTLAQTHHGWRGKIVCEVRR